MTSFQCYKMLKQIAFLAMLCIMAGCATTQTSDNYANKVTLEPANRVFFDVNETLDQALIKPELLDAHEIAWLDKYLQPARTQLSKLLETPVASWLADVTEPHGSAGIS